MMKEINNLELILAAFPNLKENEFVNAYVVSRKKDGNETNKVHKVYYIRSKEELRELMREMRTLSLLHNARTYINISTKSFEQLQKNVTKRLVEMSLEGTFVNLQNIVDSEAGKLKNNIWVVDVDDMDMVGPVRGLLRSSADWYIEVPTVSGVHFLTTKFDSRYMADNFTGCELKKDCMGTLLYYAQHVAGGEK